jgi:hypothetical protein
MFDEMLKSSTPDGLAPISLLALKIFTYSFAGLSLCWGIFNLIRLLKIGPDDDEDGLTQKLNQTEQIR